MSRTTSNDTSSPGWARYSFSHNDSSAPSSPSVSDRGKAVDEQSSSDPTLTVLGKLERKSGSSRVQQNPSSPKGKRMKSAFLDEEAGVQRCRHCDWIYPTPNPSARTRRDHKKKCGKIQTVQQWLQVIDPGDQDLQGPIEEGPRPVVRNVAMEIDKAPITSDQELEDREALDFANVAVAEGTDDRENDGEATETKPNGEHVSKSYAESGEGNSRGIERPYNPLVVDGSDEVADNDAEGQETQVDHDNGISGNGDFDQVETDELGNTEDMQEPGDARESYVKSDRPEGPEHQMSAGGADDNEALRRGELQDEAEGTVDPSIEFPGLQSEANRVDEDDIGDGGQEDSFSDKPVETMTLEKSGGTEDGERDERNGGSKEELDMENSLPAVDQDGADHSIGGVGIENGNTDGEEKVFSRSDREISSLNIEDVDDSFSPIATRDHSNAELADSSSSKPDNLMGSTDLSKFVKPEITVPGSDEDTGSRVLVGTPRSILGDNKSESSSSSSSSSSAGDDSDIDRGTPGRTSQVERTPVSGFRQPVFSVELEIPDAGDSRHSSVGESASASPWRSRNAVQDELMEGMTDDPAPPPRIRTRVEIRVPETPEDIHTAITPTFTATTTMNGETTPEGTPGTSSGPVHQVAVVGSSIKEKDFKARQMYWAEITSSDVLDGHKPITSRSSFEDKRPLQLKHRLKPVDDTQSQSSIDTITDNSREVSKDDDVEVADSEASTSSPHAGAVASSPDSHPVSVESSSSSPPVDAVSSPKSHPVAVESSSSSPPMDAVSSPKSHPVAVESSSSPPPVAAASSPNSHPASLETSSSPHPVAAASSPNSHPVSAASSPRPHLVAVANYSISKSVDVASSSNYSISQFVDLASSSNSHPVSIASSSNSQPVVEYDVERVVHHQNTHDIMCPVCGSCITKRVILRKRKRTEIPKYDSKWEEIDPASPLAEPVRERELEPEPERDSWGWGCLSCFSVFFPGPEAESRERTSCLEFICPKFLWRTNSLPAVEPSRNYQVDDPALVEPLLPTSDIPEPVTPPTVESQIPATREDEKDSVSCFDYLRRNKSSPVPKKPPQVKPEVPVPPAESVEQPALQEEEPLPVSTGEITSPASEGPEKLSIPQEPKVEPPPPAVSTVKVDIAVKAEITPVQEEPEIQQEEVRSRDWSSAQVNLDVLTRSKTLTDSAEQPDLRSVVSGFVDSPEAPKVLPADERINWLSTVPKLFWRARTTEGKPPLDEIRPPSPVSVILSEEKNEPEVTDTDIGTPPDDGVRSPPEESPPPEPTPSHDEGVQTPEPSEAAQPLPPAKEDSRCLPLFSSRKPSSMPIEAKPTIVVHPQPWKIMSYPDMDTLHRRSIRVFWDFDETTTVSPAKPKPALPSADRPPRKTHYVPVEVDSDDEIVDIGEPLPAIVAPAVALPLVDDGLTTPLLLKSPKGLSAPELPHKPTAEPCSCCGVMDIILPSFKRGRKPVETPPIEEVPIIVPPAAEDATSAAPSTSVSIEAPKEEQEPPPKDEYTSYQREENRVVGHVVTVTTTVNVKNNIEQSIEVQKNVTHFETQFDQNKHILSSEVVGAEDLKQPLTTIADQEEEVAEGEIQADPPLIRKKPEGKSQTKASEIAQALMNEASTRDKPDHQVDTRVHTPSEARERERSCSCLPFTLPMLSLSWDRKNDRGEFDELTRPLLGGQQQTLGQHPESIIDIPPAHATVSGTTPLTPGRIAPAASDGFEVVKSIVYGGLDTTLISLGVVASSTGADAKTRTVIIMGLANLIFGFFPFLGIISNLYRSDRAQFKQQVGPSFRFNGFLAVFSYILFGLMPPLTYGFSFRNESNRDYKMGATSLLALFCIILLGWGKARVTFQSAFKLISTLITTGFVGAIACYQAGDYVSMLLDYIGFDSV
ncbi:hypothetical protein Mp_6g12950 [Marchantia polymorpha subsp. ruderalis]|uniref:Uncharacterized protein n=4 Tax=Marchantia polymorpha TaxID=3197 RepID=A0AAF6BRH2_MARPO|nr:hypothetical protein MARPO_0059s0053 [Marchantia polymorpha]BBN14606.1 hypothetical protein Mp_6g12950 [Marchantia polymorpha subsp. ruderalis]|eukprot:PTQ37115.1 hypothetical protein MARPO_0059s0053 [Marchantia polymorpha]